MQSFRRQSALLTLLLAALLLRGLLPVGYMPERDAAGELVIALCTPQGLKAGQATTEAASPAHAGAAMDCPYGFALAHAAPPPAAAAREFALPPIAVAAATNFVDAGLFLYGAHSARGPPALL